MDGKGRWIFYGWVALLGACASVQTAIEKGNYREVLEKTQRIGQAVVETERPFTPQEEDAIGQMVALEILSRYPLVEDESLQLYVNSILQVVSRVSDRPVVYGGYTAGVVASSVPNAYSAPGGYIFLTQGLLNSIENEDELAAAVAHEVAHVVLRHGLASVKRAQRAKLIGSLVQEAASEEDRWKTYAQALGSVVQQVTTQVLEKGWTRDQEWDADSLAFLYLVRAGYDPRALARLLERLKGKISSKKRLSFLRTHPDMEARIRRLRSWSPPRPVSEADVRVRAQRFRHYVHISGR